MRLKIITTILLTWGFANVTAIDDSNENTPETQRIVSLKHRRYKPQHNVSVDREASPSHAYVQEHVNPPIPIDAYDPHHKSSRSGISLQKAPPDLQFGLAFTVPFVSLSTEKLLNGVSGKNFDSVSSLLKLNFSGLLLAAVVGLLAAAAIFLPSFLGPGASGSGPWLDNLIPHFSDQQYNDYENGWGGKPGGSWGKEYSARKSRAFDTVSSLGFNVIKWMDKLKHGVGKIEKCAVQRVCQEKSHGGGKLTKFIQGLTGKEKFNDVGIVKVISNVVNGDLTICEKLKALDCEAFKDIENTVMDIVGSGGSGGSAEEKSKESKV
ncbi:unnamed protein product [Orchesella dallaii]|uniref:Uncharacterized protein n=1 Tax=Orchesella dallaii TaxID=48710 RepID=A0ABP1Q8U5_9HEXA